MSKVKIEGNASGSGTFTIASPNSNTDRTLTLPDVAGTLLTADGDGSSLTGISSYSDSDALTLFNASGSAPVYACRAWVNFNGSGTVAIRSSGNVTSITDNGTGNYTVNFTTALPDTDYIAVCNGDRTDTGVVGAMCGVTSTSSQTTNAFQVINANTANGVALDGAHIFVSVFR